MPHRHVVAWTWVISCRFFTGLHAFDHALNEFTLSAILRRCAESSSDSHLGTSSHAHIIKSGFIANTVLTTALLHFYSKQRRLGDAIHVFGCMNCRDAVSWTTIISAHVLAADWRGATQFYCAMIHTREFPNEFTFTWMLQMATLLGPHYGKSIHAHLLLFGAELNLVLKTALVVMYSKHHMMEEAYIVFRQTPQADVALWTALLSGYTQAGDCNASVATFREMVAVGVRPNPFTYATLIASSSASSLGLGKQFHSWVMKVGLEHDSSVGNALVVLYSKCSDVVPAFHEIDTPNVISWTSLISGLGQQGRDEEAFHVFAAMRAASMRPNSFTLSSILTACGSHLTLNHGKMVHAFILKTRSGFSNMIVGNSLIDLYSRSRRNNDAWNVFVEMPCRDVITYTSLVKGLNQVGLHTRALDMVAYMREDDMKMDGFCLASFLSASAGITAVEYGKQLHCHSQKSGLCCWISVLNSLVDMYSKCGKVAEAHNVFMEIKEPNVISWNGLISGLASNGRFMEALSAFEDMRLVGVPPDGVTFLLVLSACSHGGLPDLGADYFHSMKGVFGILPNLDHYVCLVDMLGRAGKLEEALMTIRSMPFWPDALVYKTLLASCKVHGNLVLGEHAAWAALEIEPSDPAVYVLLSGIYDDAGRPDLGEQTRRAMRENVSGKCRGQSWMTMGQ